VMESKQCERGVTRPPRLACGVCVGVVAAGWVGVCDVMPCCCEGSAPIQRVSLTRGKNLQTYNLQTSVLTGSVGLVTDSPSST
jgi:hypothetical protein